MFNLLIVALVRNCDPFFPPEGSGLFGFDEAPDFLMEEPFFPTLAALAAMNFLLLAFFSCFRLDYVFFTILKF